MGRKVISIYILQDPTLIVARYNEIIKRISLYKHNVLKGEINNNDFAQMVNGFFEQFTCSNIMSVHDIPTGYIWDKETNGIDKPYKAYCDDSTRAWWINKKGKRIRSTIRGLNGSIKTNQEIK